MVYKLPESFALNEKVRTSFVQIRYIDLLYSQLLILVHINSTVYMRKEIR